MKVYLIGSETSTKIATAHFFQRNGNFVSCSENVLSDGKIYVFSKGHAAMKQLQHALVILDLRDDTELIYAAWGVYADMCLVHNKSIQTQLIDKYGFEAERIFVVSNESQFAKAIHVGLHDRASIKRQEQIKNKPAKNLQALSANSPFQTTKPLAQRLKTMHAQSDIMLRNYHVKSNIPLFGSIITWIRRNLTSHLREPYIDTMLERQVDFNRNMTTMLHDLFNMQLDSIVQGDDNSHNATVEINAMNDVTVLEINDATLDSQYILEKVAQRVTRRDKAGLYDLTDNVESISLIMSDSDKTSVTDISELRQDSMTLLQYSQLHETSFTSHIPFIGNMIVRFRYLWNWISTKWYVLPIMHQQSSFNQRVSITINKIIEYQEFLNLQLHHLQTRMAFLEEKEGGQ